jgi:protein TonB
LALSLALHGLAAGLFLQVSLAGHAPPGEASMGIELVRMEEPPPPAPPPPAPAPPQPDPPKPELPIPKPAAKPVHAPKPVASLPVQVAPSPPSESQEEPAAATVAAAPPAPAPAAAPVGADDDSLAVYARMVWARIDAMKPRGVRLPGMVRVNFAIAPDGTLAFVRLEDGEGSVLGSVALETMRAAAPFPKPPPQALPAQLVYTVPFRFTR